MPSSLTNRRHQHFHQTQRRRGRKTWKTQEESLKRFPNCPCLLQNTMRNTRRRMRQERETHEMKEHMCSRDFNVAQDKMRWVSASVLQLLPLSFSFSFSLSRLNLCLLPPHSIAFSYKIPFSSFPFFQIPDARPQQTAFKLMQLNSEGKSLSLFPVDPFGERNSFLFARLSDCFFE